MTRLHFRLPASDQCPFQQMFSSLYNQNADESGTNAALFVQLFIASALELKDNAKRQI